MAIIDYGTPKPPDPRPRFRWLIDVFSSGALVSVLLLGPMTDHVLLGGAGSGSLMLLRILSVPVTAAIAAVVYVAGLRNARPAVQTGVAAAFGLMAVSPMYVLLVAMQIL